MSENGSGGRSADDAELAELRRRAYGPDADIDRDPGALARLEVLEDSVRARFTAAEAPGSPTQSTEAPATEAQATEAQATEAPPRPATSEAPPRPATSETPPRPATANARPTPEIATHPGAHPTVLATPVASSIPNDAAAAESTSVDAITPSDSSSQRGGLSRRAPRWHTALLAGTAVAALALAGVAWDDATHGAQADAAAQIPAVEDQDWSMSSAADFTNYLDGLRDELLAGEGMETVADRVIREQLLPYGDLYGHTVWAGSTIDGEYCMIIDEAPSPSIGCISVEDAYASPRTIVLPARVTDNAAEAGLEPGAPISYTLLPGGKVVAEPSDAWTYPLD